MVSKSQAAAIRKYDEKNTRQIVLKLNKNTDTDILTKLDTLFSKQGYIKELIRNDIQQNKGQLLCDYPENFIVHGLLPISIKRMYDVNSFDNICSKFLNEEERNVLRMLYKEKRTYKEIAEELNCVIAEIHNLENSAIKKISSEEAMNLFCKTVPYDDYKKALDEIALLKEEQFAVKNYANGAGDIEIESLDIPNRLKNRLHSNGINTLGDLSLKRKREIAEMDGIGPSFMKMLDDVLRENKLMYKL